MAEAAIALPADYAWQRGKAGDRAALLAVMERAYREQFPAQSHFGHLEATVVSYFSSATPLWWLLTAATPVGCLWLGQAVDQVSGDRYTHIFLLYVQPPHRRRGLGTALLHQAETWARAQGDRQLGLHVFSANRPARTFYQQHGCETQSLLMVKRLV
ncbi:MAG: GNAT family N-acetyltransferase [Spirulinaceae cyanobacterium RM2_2_10]|nr:GNAT family N-acetyltransferase [Spirulinaceae cyanobacterium SM2_1_0]NJO20786.1 GNAT family N-acetyltransferase [Spirulinaceae cyanobacterium RM2_2_10]